MGLHKLTLKNTKTKSLSNDSYMYSDSLSDDTCSINEYGYNHNIRYGSKRPKKVKMKFTPIINGCGSLKSELRASLPKASLQKLLNGLCSDNHITGKLNMNSNTPSIILNADQAGNVNTIDKHSLVNTYYTAFCGTNNNVINVTESFSKKSVHQMLLDVCETINCLPYDEAFDPTSVIHITYDYRVKEYSIGKNAFLHIVDVSNENNFSILNLSAVDDEDGKFSKYYRNYEFFVIGKKTIWNMISDYISTLSAETEAFYFTINSYFYDAKNDDILYNSIHLNKEKFNDIIEGLHRKIDIDKLIAAYQRSAENILILFGEPGTGKTTIIRQFIMQFAKSSNFNPKIYYTKDPEVLKKDLFWNMMLSDEPDLLILDDLDDELQPRKAGSDNAIVNKLLSVSDGIFKINTKIIITTNKGHQNIDSAIIRPGRCFDILNIPVLTNEEALSVWVDVLHNSADDFVKIFGTSTVKQSFLMSEHQKIKKHVCDYLVYDTISVRDQYVKQKSGFGFNQ